MSKEKQIFITKQEQEFLVSYHNNQGIIIEELGKVELAKENLKAKKNSLISAFNETKNKEIELLKKLEETYGRGSIDRETGEFFSG